MKFNNEGLNHSLSTLKEFALELDEEKQFHKFLLFRKLSFSLLDNIDADYTLIRLFSYRIGKLLSDFMIIDKSYANNLHAYISIKYSEDILDEEKVFLKEGFDFFIKPKGNKQIPDIDRFCAAYFIYMCSYKNKNTSRDEARKFVEYVFGITETDARKSTRLFAEYYKIYSERKEPFYKEFKDILNSIFFLRMSIYLENKCISFDELFTKYQRVSSKAKSTTNKTYKAYQDLKGQIIKENFQMIDVQNSKLNLAYTFGDDLNLPNPEDLHSSFLVKSIEKVLEEEMFYLPLLKEHHPYKDTL